MPSQSSAILDIDKFEDLYKTYQPILVNYANFFLKNEHEAIDIVQELFISIWEKNNDLSHTLHLKSYLLAAVKNKCINKINRNTHQVPLDELLHDVIITEDTELLNRESKETELEIRKRIDQLPPKSKEIFMMSRFEQLSYKEIASQLNISVKTVENQIGNAIKALRKFNFTFLWLIISLLQNIIKSLWG